MNKHAHSVGPWVVDESGSIGTVETRDGLVNIAQASQVVGDTTSQDVRRANARLIAAAPDMKSALQMAHAELEFGGNWEAARRVVEAALAKAGAKP